MTRRAWLVVLVVLAAAAAGCGGEGPTKPPDFGGEEATAVVRAIDELNENVNNAKRFADSFAKGAVTAADAKKYAAFSYYVLGKPTLTGTEATAKVSVQSGKTGTEAGQMDWAFVKEGDKWKIKSAPLPAGK